MLSKLKRIITNALLSLIPFLIGFYFSIAFLISQPTGLDEVILEAFSVQNSVFAIGVFVLGLLNRSAWRNRLFFINLFFLLSHFIFGSYIYPKRKEAERLQYKLFRYNKHKANARFVLNCRDGYELILTNTETKKHDGKVAYLVLYPKDKSLGSYPLDKIYRGRFVPSIYRDEPTLTALETCKGGEHNYKSLVELLKSEATEN